jgi:hypothetical protein
MLRVNQLDGKWLVPSEVNKHPLIWMISINGFIMDARWAPRPIQEEANRRGLIPYLPESSFSDE